MKAENTSTNHNRIINLTDLPTTDPDDLKSMWVTIGYAVPPGETRRDPVFASVLDHVVVPALIEAVNRRHELRNEHLMEVAITSLNAFDKVYDAITAIKDMTVLKTTKVARDLQVYMQEMEKLRHAIVVTGRQPDNPVNPAVLRSQLESQE